MTVRCARCGEELLGAVNRCWKCGQQFAALPTVDGLPPVRAEIIAAVTAAATTGQAALEARILDDASANGPDPAQTQPVGVLVAPPPMQPPPSPLPVHPLSTPRPQRLAVAQPTNVAAVGGAYAAFLLGIFALVISGFRYEGRDRGVRGAFGRRVGHLFAAPQLGAHRDAAVRRGDGAGHLHGRAATLFALQPLRSHRDADGRGNRCAAVRCRGAASAIHRCGARPPTPPPSRDWSRAEPGGRRRPASGRSRPARAAGR